MTSDPGQERLRTYLADHLAGATGALELIGYLRDHAADPAIRTLMMELHAEIGTDRGQLQLLAEKVGGGSQPLKETAAWLGEKFSRIKLASTDSTPDSLPLLEAVEALSLGILGKVKLWEGLAGLELKLPAVAGFDLAELRRRALVQHTRVEAERLRLARESFAPASS